MEPVYPRGSRFRCERAFLWAGPCILPRQGMAAYGATGIHGEIGDPADCLHLRVSYLVAMEVVPGYVTRHNEHLVSGNAQ